MLTQLESQNGTLLRTSDPEGIIDIFDSLPPQAPYHEIPREVGLVWRTVLRDHGNKGFGVFQKITMLRLISQFNEIAQKRGYKYTPEIMDQFSHSYTRIGSSIDETAFNGYDSINDIMLKDLALCRQCLFPGGARVIERFSAFPRSLLFRDSLAKSIEFLWLMVRSGGNKPYYQWHTHLSELKEFNAEGWQTFCRRVASMLEINPSVRGMFGSSWLYDPALETVSPNLAYHNVEPLRNGAHLFYFRDDPDGGALSKSRTRQRLYREGRYVPKAYALVWPRKPLIEWAKRTSEPIGRSAKDRKR